MRHIVLSAFILALVVMQAPVHAQSGRNRTGQTSKETKTSGQASTESDSSDIEAPTTQGANGAGETVEGDVLRVDTALVTVPVSVTDRDGKNVPHLRRQEFHIFDDGV